jgi:hypothetical protein
MIGKTAAAIIGAVLVVTAVLWAGHGKGAPAPPASQPGNSVLCGGARYRGLSVQVASGWYQPREKYGRLLQEIADLGANTVLFCIPGYMEHAQTQYIYMDLRKVPPPEDFKWIIGRARELGLCPILMPIVLLKNPRGSEWRGVIEPPDWEEWWRQYYDFALFFADLAREGRADALIVGSELVSTEKYTDKWVELIEQCRKRFYGGKLGYSANWDHYRPIQFWDKLDFIGMTSYYTLADKNSPTIEEIVERWEPIRKEVLAWQHEVGKPLLMTEVGWCSQEGAAKAPWNYYQNQVATPAGMEEQRRLYEAFIRAWDDTPELMGVIWWEWEASEGGSGDFGYSPKAKPAEQVLRQWFKAGRPTTSAPASENP